MNNKGQSLVLFVLLIPIALLLFILVIDVGRLILFRNNLDSINYMAMNYLLSNKEDDLVIQNTRELIKKNDNGIDNIKIEYNDNKYNITLEDKFSGLLFNFEKINVSVITSNYSGYIYNNKNVIEKVG